MRLVRNIFIRHGVNFSFRGLLQTPCLIPVNLSARQDRAEFDNAFYRTALRFFCAVRNCIVVKKRKTEEKINHGDVYSLAETLVLDIKLVESLPTT